MLKRFLFGLVASIALAGSASAQTYNGTGFAIPDGGGTGNPGSSTISVGDSYSIQSLNWVGISLSTTHTWIGDVVVTLTAPNGDDVQLIRRPGSGTFGSSGEWQAGSHVFFDSGTDPFVPQSGNMAPGNWRRSAVSSVTNASLVALDGDGYSVFNGDSVNGGWTLRISDYATPDTGVVGSWSMNFTAVPEPSAILFVLGPALLLGVKRRRG